MWLPSRLATLALAGPAVLLAAASPAHAVETGETITEQCDLQTPAANGAYASTGQHLTPRLSYSATVPTATTNGQFRVSVHQGALDFTAADRAVLGQYGLEYSGGKLTRLDLSIDGATPSTLPIATADIPLDTGTLSDQDGYTGIRFPAYGYPPTSALVTRVGSPSSYLMVRTGPVTYDTLLGHPGETPRPARIACTPAPLPTEANLMAVVGPSGSGGQPSRILSLSPSSGSTAGGTIVRAVYTNASDSDDFRTASVDGRLDWGSGILGDEGPTVTFKTPAGYAGTVPVRLSASPATSRTTVENGAADDFTYLAPPPSASAAGFGRPTKALCNTSFLRDDGSVIDPPVPMEPTVTIDGAVPASIPPGGQFSVSGAHVRLSFPYTGAGLIGWGNEVSISATRLNLGVTGGATVGVDASGLPSALSAVAIPTRAEADADPTGSVDFGFPGSGSLAIGPITPAGAAGSTVGLSWVGLSTELSFAGDGVRIPLFQRARADCFVGKNQTAALASVRVGAPALPPLLTRASPNNGPVAGGGIAVISGVRLDGATAVRFGAIKAKFFASGKTLVAQIPAQKAPGIYPITVTAPGGTSTASTGLRYRYQ